ncbi:type 1 fimbrial protein [Erwinia psidii]|uniref:fimbrial protein n=1 Tax=Erwinia psidii TaxID=69224 RepID=UPI00226B510F|nr:fimbrial protein [Erwinia psidii]MCX8962425.1 type 1 fimbrial protein [Erwinia psidii]
MRFKKIIQMSLYIIVTISGIASFSVGASCTLTSPALTVNIPALMLSPTEKGAVGTSLFSRSIPVSQVGYDCGSDVRSSWTSAYTRPEISKSSLTNVYNTGLAGIGIRIKWPASRADNAWVPGTYSCQGSCIEQADDILVEFVQTGNVSGGTIPAGSIITVAVSPDNDPQNTLTLLTVNLGLVTVQVSSCAIYADTNSVNLGDYSLSAIKASGFQGDKKDFTITLDCPTSSSAKITFEGKNAWGMSSGVIENAGSAKNAYIKLYQKNVVRYTEKALNTADNFGSSTAFTGKRTVTYAGEMYFEDGTRESVTAGTVTANIIYTLTIN